MKKPYQIAAGRAVQRVRQWAEEKNPVVQLMLPMIEILALAKRGAGELVRAAGLRIILLAIQQEADALTGGRHQQGPDRQALRWCQGRSKTRPLRRRESRPLPGQLGVCFD